MCIRDRPGAGAGGAGRADGAGVGASAERRLRVGRPEGGGYGADPRGVCGLSAAFAERAMERVACGAAVRAEFRDRAVQLHVRESVSDAVPPLSLIHI